MTTPRVWVYPCGCVERDRRGSGDLERDCGDPGCYRRTAPATHRLNREQRRRLRR